MRNEESDKIGIIGDIRKQLSEEISPIITKRWERKCPTCNAVMSYSRRWDCNNAEQKKTCCMACGGKKTIEIRKRKNNLYGHTRSQSYKDYMSKLHSGVNNPFYGKRHTKKSIDFFRIHSHNTPRTKTWRENIAKALRIYLTGYYGCCNFNKTACKCFDKLNEVAGWNGRHALNGGEFLVKELGYWVDYYEPTENVVIEWDERHHFVDGKLKARDLKRMNEIKQHLKCKFFRYNQVTNELKEW